MQEKECNIAATNSLSSRHVSSRPSLFKTLAEVKEQVDYMGFARAAEYRRDYAYIEPLYDEICLNIAEMLVRPPDAVIRIRGADMEAAIVQEVYRALTHDHIELVAYNFKAQTSLIRNTKAYLQTALYNVLFELDAHYTNRVRHNHYNNI